jgi:hypothetical protein
LRQRVRSVDRRNVHLRASQMVGSYCLTGGFIPATNAQHRN